jgi:preprotein translocase subunit SecA
MRLFGSERVMGMMESLGVDDDTPIDAKILSGAIENAQKRVESRNFQSRKNVLEYDDVMNVQRKVIYEQRRKVLDGEDLKGAVENMIGAVIENAVRPAFGEQHHLSAEAWRAIRLKFEGVFLRRDELHMNAETLEAKSADDLIGLLRERAFDIYARKEQALGAPLMRELERVSMLRVVDMYWMDHIDAMDELRRGIGLQAYGQTDPVVEYKRVGYDMFQEMNETIREETVRQIFIRQVRTQNIQREKVAKITGTSGGADGTVKKQPVRRDKKVGPNDPCPCGSGKKYKQCCRRKDLGVEE